MADLSRIALILAAHGDRGSSDRNAVLRRHAASLRNRGVFKDVAYGVLNGEPQLTDVLIEMERTNAAQLMVYPFFMSDGYFAEKVLPERIDQARLATPLHILQPLGLDPALPHLLLRMSLEAALSGAFEPKTARLLIAGHGSKFGRASANATVAVVDAVRAKAVFARVTAAFLEETPFVADALQAENMPTVVAGFFSGEGMHGHDDVPEAIRKAAIPCVYTRPVGSHPDIAGLIEAAALEAVSNGSA